MQIPDIGVAGLSIPDIGIYMPPARGNQCLSYHLG